MTNKPLRPGQPPKRSNLQPSIQGDVEHLFKKAVSAHRQGRLARAEKGYQKILKKKPDWGRALNALGNLFLDQNRPEKAAKIFEKATRITPPDLSACYNLGRMKQMDNNHRGAIPIYKMMLEQQPDIGDAWNNLGVAYREIGNKHHALSCFQKAVNFAPGMAEAWNNLGVAQDELTQSKNALDSYNKAIEIEPDYASAHLNIGICLQKREEFKKAQSHYNKVLEIQPDNKVATFMLQSLGILETPDAAPVEHVRNIFDRCADNFETILVKDLAYKTPERLFELVQPHLTEKMNVLDLGCGTGLGAQFYKPFAKHLTGVDVSLKMLEKAAEKNIYNRLEVFDILQEWPFFHKFDLIYSSDVFVYFGNLDSIIKSASTSLVNGGILGFSVELLEDSSHGYALFPSGRYAHSQAYIEQCLECHGFQLMEKKKADIRKQSGVQVKGMLIVAIKIS
ncbi:Predicted methyltransferase, contains TPR repeat [Desulfocicer vacuolatum DSM 3385]|uniref:Predicted methyltransferase, contains TPR repeat n=1 Tax=Desulfocicer vacuolatum DSM 3385 TaxID=1121400 RepID=A0A1W1YRP9_9BACT|nr:tetratricopeptide repeat protein [Desulfocicer vacuolatum]SMC38803.1 Predicted methyltransferase, contains TPR repeat [Desulfocicer vacuolatum DSM 3385]